MSLIICSKCGKQITDKAEKCIHCGNPITSYSESKQYCGDSKALNLLDVITNYKKTNTFYKILSTICCSAIIIWISALFAARFCLYIYFFKFPDIDITLKIMLIFIMIQDIIISAASLFSKIKTNYIKKFMIFMGTKNSTFDYKETVLLLKTVFENEKLNVMHSHDTYTADMAWPIIFCRNNKKELIPYLLLFVIDILYAICLIIILAFALKLVPELLPLGEMVSDTAIEAAFWLFVKWLLLFIIKGISSKIILSIIKKKKKQFLAQTINADCK